jgi:putative acetyltransferase
MSETTVTIRPAETPSDIESIRELFLEYADSLGFSLCFQGFDEELKRLPGEYAPPSGRLFLAEFEGKPAGCIALKKKDAESCEMKRLYLREICRGKGVGRALAERLIAEARVIGYKRMVLDTIEHKMIAAVGLYRSLGFVARTPYYDNPHPGALFMVLELTATEDAG